jgi:DNA-binding NtrC family response regulator
MGTGLQYRAPDSSPLGDMMRNKGPVQLIGVSQAISELKSEVERVARSDAKVLITGESGSGKEVVARAINDTSSRAKVFPSTAPAFPKRFWNRSCSAM